MVVYLDVLVCLNIVITYFILLAAKSFSRSKSNVYRLIAASVTGGLLSTYIFLPKQHFLFELLVKIIFGAVITLIAFKKSKLKAFLRAFMIFNAVSFLYAGSMIGVWYAIKPKGMVINNGVVYFKISPIVLICGTVLCYLVLRLAQILLKREDTYSQITPVKLFFGEKSVVCRCIVDTGNTLCDSVSGYKIAVISISTANELFTKEQVTQLLNFEADNKLAKRFRVIPYKTLSGNSLLPCVCIDGACVGDLEIKKTMVAIVNTVFDGDYSGIISPEFIM